MFASPALAQSLCLPRADVVKELKEGYGETPVARGLTNANDRLVELFASEDGETWTLIITFPKGPTCIITTGHDWQSDLPKLLKPTGLPI